MNWSPLIRRLLISVGGAAALSVGACASMPEAPPNAPPALSFLEQIGTPAVLHSNVIEAAGPVSLASGPAGRDEPLATIPYRYRYTAILTEDVVGYSITVPGVQAPAGAPGYYAGTFAAAGPYASRTLAELWCFIPAAVGGDRAHLCFLKNQPGIAAIAPTRMNAWLWNGFAPATGSFDYVKTPIYERREVDIPADLKLEYRFRGWSRSAARLSEYAVDREVRTFEVPLETDGSAVIRTVAGNFAIAPAPGDPERAVISRR